MKKITRIFHHYEKWEDYKNGMYEEKRDSNKMNRIIESTILLSTPELLYLAMKNVSQKWINSSEVNLSNRSCNRRAWLGQAACNYDIGAVESEVREAWGMLSQEERDKANSTADKVIEEWEKEYLNKGEIA